MTFLSTKSRIAIAQVLLVVSAVFGAAWLGILPNPNALEIERRVSLCRVIAVSCSDLANREGITKLPELLTDILDKTPVILSGAVRDADGGVLQEIGDHLQHWDNTGESKSVSRQLVMSIFSGGAVSGTIELRFGPVSQGGIVGYIRSPGFHLAAFLGSFCFLFNYVFLGRKLQHLDPSRAVPGRVRAALDTLTEGLLVLDRREWVVLANRAFAECVGTPAARLVGQKAADFPWLISDEEQGAVMYPWGRALREETQQTGVMIGLRRSKDDIRTFMVSAAPVLNPDGGIQGTLVGFEDVTALETTKVELKKSKEAADDANRAKSDFLANMSHEIRTPMNAILGFTEVLQRGLEDDSEKKQSHLNTIHRSGKHLLNLINDILDLSKIEAGRMELELADCWPHQVIGDVTSVLRVRAESKGISLDFRSEGGLPETIITDSTRLRQLITNLVGNAIKFTDQGGVQVVAKVLTSGKKPALQIQVIDSGIGMSPEQTKKIFDPFTQADASVTRRFGGTGLGLSISKRIAEALGGSLTVSSKPGTGSTFTAVIETGPLHNVRMLDDDEARIANQRRQETEKTELTLPPSRILVVDDSEANRRLMALVLGRAGVEVGTANNGQEAIEEATSGDFDIVLMDMQMPVMDGFTATQALRQQGYTKPIIALTADAMLGAEERCREAGCSGFLTKPIDMDLLIRTLARELQEMGVQRARHSMVDEAPDTRPIVDAKPVVTEQRETEELVLTRPDTSPASSDRGHKTANPSQPPIRSSFFADDPETREIIADYVDHLHSQLSDLEAAWGKDDLDEVERIAHAIKGSAGTLGFEAFTEPAQTLMFLAKKRQTGQIDVAIEELTEMAGRIEVPEESPATGK